jgi:hypothetical protein
MGKLRRGGSVLRHICMRRRRLMRERRRVRHRRHGKWQTSHVLRNAFGQRWGRLHRRRRRWRSAERRHAIRLRLFVVDSRSHSGNQIGRYLVHSRDSIVGCLRSSLLDFVLTMLVIVIVPDFNIFKAGQCIIGQHGAGRVKRKQVGGDAQTVEPHEPGR